MPPAKAVKTERTHEENQERAYIAASRRSDRSLEARVESARRASEIHKRRTGRSLRVTEQDVINEEMYEEEDDDLPVQYRRLTAHLQTGSVDFNRRLAAYLTNQVAMRSAMDQMINSSYAQQYPNAPQFAHNTGHPTFSSPLPGNMTQSPTNTHRSVPYPSPHPASLRQTHNRSYSTTDPIEASLNPTSLAGSSSFGNQPERRMSTPADYASAGMFRPLKTEDIKPDPDHQRQTQSAMAPMANAYAPFWQDMGPFTTALPPESQQMLGPALDPQDPMTSMLMAGSEMYTSSPYYPWGGMPHPVKTDMGAPAYGGMFSTLAPSALDNTPDFTASGSKSRHGSSDSSNAYSAGPEFNSASDSNEVKVVQGYHPLLTRENSAAALGSSGQITPGEGFWDSFVQDGGWNEETTTAN